MTTQDILTENFLREVDEYWMQRDFDTAVEEFNSLYKSQSKDNPISAINNKLDAARKIVSEKDRELIKIQTEIASLAPEDIEADLDEKIKSVDSQLKQFYACAIKKEDKNKETEQKEILIHVFNENEALELSAYNFSPRLRFLIKKYFYLKIQKDSFAKKLFPAITEEKMAAQNKQPDRFKSVFNVGKKFIDILDDLWGMTKFFLPSYIFDLIAPFLVGAVGFIIHFAEGFKAIKQGYHAYLNENSPQRKTRIVTSALAFFFTGIGAGLSIAFLVGEAGLNVAGQGLIPVISPTLLTGVYALSLWKRSYIFNRAKEEEDKAKAQYEEYLNEYLPIIKHVQKVSQELECQYNEIQAQIRKLTANSGGHARNEKYNMVMTLLHRITTEQKKYEDVSAQLHGEIEAHQKNYQYIRQKRLDAERFLAFNTVEVATSTIVLVASILGTAAVVGAGSVASFGALPLALLLTGVIIGVITKGFEDIDKKKHHQYTCGIRNWFVNKWNDFFYPTPKAKQVMTNNNDTRPSQVKPETYNESMKQIFAVIPESKHVNETETFDKEKIVPVPAPVTKLSTTMSNQAFMQAKTDFHKHQPRIQGSV